jgi:hypothetical protein
MIKLKVITKIFEECFNLTMKSIGIELQEMTLHSKMTLNYLIDSIKVTDKCVNLKKIQIFP